MKYYCGNCGSTDVVWDAWARPNDAGDGWEVTATFDHCECSNCGSEDIQDGGCETA